MVCSYGIGYVNMRLDKFLADMGAGTRSDIKKDIRKGKVTVGGETVKSADLQVDPESDVCYCGRKITYAVNEYYMVNKPAGVISASDDARQSTVIDLLPDEKRQNLFPVGRLDKDTEGLLIITNDGALAHRLLSPKNHVDKVYYAKVSGIVTDTDIKCFAEGMRIGEDIVTLPAKLEVLGTSYERISEVFVTIHEGKFHQIKKMFEVRGKEVLYLKRLSMGPLRLDDTLAPGEYRKLSDEEISELRKW